jgi:hypothetical protein
MTSYRVDIGSRSRRVGRFIARVRSELLRAVDEERRTAHASQQAIAQRLEQDRSAINRQLSGEANLTLRSVAELSWALGREIKFELRKPIEEIGQNINIETSTIEWKKPTVIGPGGEKLDCARHAASGRNATTPDLCAAGKSAPVVERSQTVSARDIGPAVFQSCEGANGKRRLPEGRSE